MGLEARFKVLRKNVRSVRRCVCHCVWMNKYMCENKCVCFCLGLCMCVHVYVYIYVCTLVCMCPCINVCVCPCGHRCVCVFLYASIYVQMCMCVCSYVYRCVCVCVWDVVALCWMSCLSATVIKHLLTQWWEESHIVNITNPSVSHTCTLTHVHT